MVRIIIFYSLCITIIFNSQPFSNLFKAVASNLHPETGDPIVPFFRWSAYAPMNIPIIVMLAILPPTTMNQVIGQSMNQTLNFGVNVCNSSASNSMDIQETVSKNLKILFFSKKYSGLWTRRFKCYYGKCWT